MVRVCGYSTSGWSHWEPYLEKVRDIFRLVSSYWSEWLDGDEVFDRISSGAMTVHSVTVTMPRPATVGIIIFYTWAGEALDWLGTRDRVVGDYALCWCLLWCNGKQHVGYWLRIKCENMFVRFFDTLSRWRFSLYDSDSLNCSKKRLESFSGLNLSWIYFSDFHFESLSIRRSFSFSFSESTAQIIWESPMSSEDCLGLQSVLALSIDQFKLFRFLDAVDLIVGQIFRLFHAQ